MKYRNLEISCHATDEGETLSLLEWKTAQSIAAIYLNFEASKYSIQPMKKLFVSTCLMMFCVFIYAQHAETNTLKNQQQKLDELKGTYELKYEGRALPMLPSNLADIIEQNRKETEVSIVKLNAEVQLIIYPRNSITNNRLKNKE